MKLKVQGTEVSSLLFSSFNLFSHLFLVIALSRPYAARRPRRPDRDASVGKGRLAGASLPIKIRTTHYTYRSVISKTIFLAAVYYDFLV